MNIVIPLAGINTEFEKRNLFKPLVNVGSKTLIERCTLEQLETLKSEIDNLFFIILNRHEQKYNISKHLLNMFRNFNPEIFFLDEPTEGAASSVLYIKKLINNKNDLIIWLGDIWFEADVIDYLKKCKSNNIAGFVPCFYSMNPKYSYVISNSSGFIKKVSEKKVISYHATAGFYYFLHGNLFVGAAEEMIKKDLRVNGAFYVAPVYNQIINQKQLVLMQSAKCIYSFGSYDDIKRFNKKIKLNTTKRNANIFAHRGSFNSRIPENSLLALKRALKKGYSVEVDVRKTIDDVLILSHDSSLERAFKRSGTIESSTYSYLCNLDYFLKHTRILRFDEFLDLFNNYASFYSKIAIHPKSYDAKMGDMIASSLLKRNLIDCSFIFDLTLSQAKQLKRKYPFVRVGASVTEDRIKMQTRRKNYFSIKDIKSLEPFDIFWLDEWNQDLYTTSNLKKLKSTRKELVAVSPELHRVDGNTNDVLKTWQMLLSNDCTQICTDMQKKLEIVLGEFYGKDRCNLI